MAIINDTDAGFKDLKGIIRGIDGTIIKTGFIEGKKGNRHRKSEIDNVALAAIHEFGTTTAGRKKNIRIKARPFMKPAFDKNKEEYENQIERAITVSLKSKNIDVFKAIAQAVGNKMKSDVVQAIDNLPQDLAQSTIDKKGSSNALVDTGQMRQAVNYFINKK